MGLRITMTSRWVRSRGFDEIVRHSPLEGVLSWTWNGPQWSKCWKTKIQFFKLIPKDNLVWKSSVFSIDGWISTSVTEVSATKSLGDDNGKAKTSFETFPRFSNWSYFYSAGELFSNGLVDSVALASWNQDGGRLKYVWVLTGFSCFVIR